jgi:hypothetical protein
MVAAACEARKHCLINELTTCRISAAFMQQRGSNPCVTRRASHQLQQTRGWFGAERECGGG